MSLSELETEETKEVEDLLPVLPNVTDDLDGMNIEVSDLKSYESGMQTIGRGRWTPQDFDIKKFRNRRDSEMIDDLVAVFNHHAKMYEEINGKEKADWWLRPQLTSDLSSPYSNSSGSLAGTPGFDDLPLLEDNMSEFQLANNMYIPAPSSGTFVEVWTDILAVEDKNSILDKEFWNLCDILALVVWGFCGDDIDFEMLHKLQSNPEAMGHSVIINPAMLEFNDSVVSYTSETYPVSGVLMDDDVSDLKWGNEEELLKGSFLDSQSFSGDKEDLVDASNYQSMMAQLEKCSKI